jgi:hypothetical protein
MEGAIPFSWKEPFHLNPRKPVVRASSDRRIHRVIDAGDRQRVIDTGDRHGWSTGDWRWEEVV